MRFYFLYTVPNCTIKAATIIEIFSEKMPVFMPMRQCSILQQDNAPDTQQSQCKIGFVEKDTHCWRVGLATLLISSRLRIVGLSISRKLLNLIRHLIKIWWRKLRKHGQLRYLWIIAQPYLSQCHPEFRLFSMPEAVTLTIS